MGGGWGGDWGGELGGEVEQTWWLVVCFFCVLEEGLMGELVGEGMEKRRERWRELVFEQTVKGLSGKKKTGGKGKKRGGKKGRVRQVMGLLLETRTPEVFSFLWDCYS